MNKIDSPFHTQKASVCPPHSTPIYTMTPSFCYITSLSAEIVEDHGSIPPKIIRTVQQRKKFRLSTHFTSLPIKGQVDLLHLRQWPRCHSSSEEQGYAGGRYLLRSVSTNMCTARSWPHFKVCARPENTRECTSCTIKDSNPGLCPG